MARCAIYRQQQAAWTAYWQSSYSCSTGATQKPVLYLLTKNAGKFSEKQQQKDQVNGPWAENGQDRKGNRTRQKNKRGDRKGESNDSPEIPDRR